jgi:hypothetical protein
LRGVVNTSGAPLEVDAVALLRAASLRALADAGLAASGGAPAAFLLDLEIAEYRPGNAFQRWLVPGWGSTLLRVRGALADGRSGSRAASIDYERSVHWGGLYTVGAWSTIFTSVAEDVVQDLKVKIERGGDFVVRLSSRAEQGPAPRPPDEGPRIKVDVLEDQRPDRRRIGERTAAFGVGMGDVHLDRPVASALREAMADDLSYAGYRIVEAGEHLRVRGRVGKFWVHTDTTALYWDIVGEIEIALTIEPAASGTASAERAYACRAVERTYAWPGESLVGKALNACLADLMGRLRADPVWAQMAR